jgi:hypothetical protein
MRDQTPRLDLHLAYAKIRDLRGHRRQGSAIDNNTFYRVARPQGCAWLQARMDAWPADYIADRWVDLSQWFMPGTAALAFADTIL